MPIDDSTPGSPATLPSVHAGAWRFVPGDSCLHTPRGKRLSLTTAECAVVRLLMATPGHHVPRDTLIAALTDDSPAFDPHRLEMLIHRLRNKVADASGENLPIRAVRGLGYVLLP